MKRTSISFGSRSAFCLAVPLHLVALTLIFLVVACSGDTDDSLGSGSTGGSGGSPYTEGAGGTAAASGGSDPTPDEPATGGALATGGTDTGTGGNIHPPFSITFQVMSYNLFGWNAFGENAWKSDNIVAHINQESPDILGTQETDGHATSIISRLTNPYAQAGDEEHGVAIFYRTDRWEFLESGTVDLVEMDEWGQRVVRWARLQHNEGQVVTVFNTHLCVCGASALEGSAKTIVQAIKERALPGEPVVLTGDFNVFDGFEESLAVQYFKNEGGLVDSYRATNPTGAVSTFGEAGKIDYIFVSPGLDVDDAWVDTTTVAPGQGSDHNAVLASLAIRGI